MAAPHWRIMTVLQFQELPVPSRAVGYSVSVIIHSAFSSQRSSLAKEVFTKGLRIERQSWQKLLQLQL